MMMNTADTSVGRSAPPKRRYSSPRRAAQARETRARILAAARRRFATDGYVATTLPAIARDAGVAAPTVTAVFGTKLALLNELIRSGVRGDDDDAPLERRRWWAAMMREPDAVRQLQRYAANARRIHTRTTDLFEIVRGAAAADPAIAALRQRLAAGRLEDCREVAAALTSRRALSPTVTTEMATDLLWALGSADLYRLLVVDRAWSPKQYEQWLAASLTTALLGRHGAPATSRTG
jgi:AcrR family transcriptional regulator